MYSASVIIAFYNDTASLDAVLHALENQQQLRQDQAIEIIIADDGSCPAAQQFVKQRAQQSPLPIAHVAQEDKGFRKNRILNKAIAISNSDYLIFLDGDCVPQEYFVYDHLHHSEKGCILNGRRVDLPAYFKQSLLESDAPHRFFIEHSASIFLGYMLGNGKNIEKGLRIRLPFLFKFLNKKSRGILGCNFSLYKEDILSVNGFNNDYTMASVGEDTDIEYRLVKTGKRIKNVLYQANVLHIMHKELPRLPEAQALFETIKAKNELIAKNGYHQILGKD